MTLTLPSTPAQWWAGLTTGDPVALALAGLTLAGLVVLVLLAAAALTRRTAVGGGRGVETGLTVVAAGIATGVSLNGMWRVFGDVLHLDGPARTATVGFLEVALIVSALRARRSLREHGTAGVDGAAVWVIAGLSALVAAADADGLAKAVRLAAPLLAAWLWERGLAADRRAARARRPITIAWRWTKERLAVRLGLADPIERTTPDVDRARRLARLTRARLRLAVLETTTLPVAVAVLTMRPVRVGFASWRLQRHALAAVEHLHLGTDPVIPVTIRTTVAAVVGLRAATTPAALTTASPWNTAAPAPPVPPEPEQKPVPAADAGARAADPAGALGMCEGCRRNPATGTWPHPPAGAPFRLCPTCTPAINSATANRLETDGGRGDGQGQPSGPGRPPVPPMPRPRPAPAPPRPRPRPVTPSEATGRASGQTSARVTGAATGGGDTAAAVARVVAAHPDWTTKDIAAELGVSARTVRRHLAAHRAAHRGSRPVTTEALGPGTAA